MDRRILKTRKTIMDAFFRLIVKHDYSKITVKDIIDEANVGRSTFYDHFETKDDVLITYSKELFEHIFNPEMNIEAHCFIDSSTLDKKITHILYHLLENKEVIKGIFRSEGSTIFISYFRKYINKFASFFKEEIKGVPYEFIENHIFGSFIEMVRYWVNNGFIESPEELADYYFKLLPKHN